MARVLSGLGAGVVVDASPFGGPVHHSPPSLIESDPENWSLQGTAGVAVLPLAQSPCTTMVNWKLGKNYPTS